MIESSIRLLVALAIPWMLGYSIVTYLLSVRSIKCIPISIGYGYFVGWAAVYSILKLAASLNNTIEIDTVCYALILVVTVLFYKTTKIRLDQYHLFSISRIIRTYKRPVILIILLILTRTISLGFELIMQPMLPWDAFTAWIPKAKLWFYMNELTKVVSFWEWRDILNMPLNLYIHDSASEKDLIPIIVLWMAIITDHWDEGVIFIPWLLAMAAFCMGFFGQASLANTHPIKTGILLLILMTLPILNAHIALAGYADLWLGLSFCLAVAAMHHWEIEKEFSQLMLFLIMTWMCYITKSESGYVWSIILCIGLCIIFFRITKNVIRITLAASVITFILLVNIGMHFEISGNIFSISERAFLFLGFLWAIYLTTMHHEQ